MNVPKTINFLVEIVIKFIIQKKGFSIPILDYIIKNNNRLCISQYSKVYNFVKRIINEIYNLPLHVHRVSVLYRHTANSIPTILFKYNLITFKAIKFSQPMYLSSLIKTSCFMHGNCLSLSSVSHKKAIGRRGFAMTSPTEWNRLTQSVRSQQTITGFRSQLKTYLFRLAYPPP